MGSRYKKINGTRILPKIKLLSTQWPRYLPYLGPCTAQFFIFSHLQLPLIFECKSNIFVTFIMWCRWLMHEPYLRWYWAHVCFILIFNFLSFYYFFWKISSTTSTSTTMATFSASRHPTTTKPALKKKRRAAQFFFSFFFFFSCRYPTYHHHIGMKMAPTTDYNLPLFVP